MYKKNISRGFSSSALQQLSYERDSLHLAGARNIGAGFNPRKMETNMQKLLADAYHTTVKPENQLSMTGEHHVVGLDFEPIEKPNGRFIWFALDNPKNEGTVLRGTNACSWNETDPARIREKAIEVATRVLGSAQRARAEIDAVVAAGGMVFPEKEEATAERQLG